MFLAKAKRFFALSLSLQIFFVAIDGLAAESPTSYLLPVDFLRPSSQLLHKTIAESRSFITKENRHTIAALIKAMDLAHMRHVRMVKGNICDDAGCKSWLKNKCLICPTPTPTSERALISALYLQIDILDFILKKTDPLVAQKLRQDRSMIRMRSKKDSFFGDIRDSFVCEILQLLKNINELQRALGAVGTINLDFPVQAKSVADIETYLIKRFVFTKNSADALSANRPLKR